MKVCVKCKAKKPITDFRLHSKGEGITYRRPECRECEKKYQKQRTANKFRKKERPKLGTSCDCCGRVDKKLILDHCHITNSFRGWLCQNCNLGIGRLGDSIEGVIKALEYLNKYYHNK
jgi:hypothetical protein